MSLANVVLSSIKSMDELWSWLDACCIGRRCFHKHGEHYFSREDRKANLAKDEADFYANRPLPYPNRFFEGMVLYKRQTAPGAL